MASTNLERSNRLDMIPNSLARARINKAAATEVFKSQIAVL